MILEAAPKADVAVEAPFSCFEGADWACAKCRDAFHLTCECLDSIPLEIPLVQPPEFCLSIGALDF